MTNIYLMEFWEMSIDVDKPGHTLSPGKKTYHDGRYAVATGDKNVLGELVKFDTLDMLVNALKPHVGKHSIIAGRHPLLHSSIRIDEDVEKYCGIYKIVDLEKLRENNIPFTQVSDID